MKKILAFAVPALAVVGFAVAVANAGNNCSSASAASSCSAEKASVQTASNGSCGSSAAVQTASGSCTSKEASVQTASGSCAAKGASVQTASMTCGDAKGASIQTVSDACAAACAAKGASASACGSKTGATTAQMDLPKGMHYTKVQVPGGVDYVFTGSGIEKLASMCEVSCSAAAAQSGATFSRTEGRGYIVLSLRGKDVTPACDAVVQTALNTSGLGEPTKS